MRLVSMNQLKKEVVEKFNKEMGFAPSMKAIIPMESSGAGCYYNWLAFCVGKIGYTYSVSDRLLERNTVYDLKEGD